MRYHMPSCGAFTTQLSLLVLQQIPIKLTGLRSYLSQLFKSLPVTAGGKLPDE